MKRACVLVAVGLHVALLAWASIFSTPKLKTTPIVVRECIVPRREEVVKEKSVLANKEATKKEAEALKAAPVKAGNYPTATLEKEKKVVNKDVQKVAKELQKLCQAKPVKSLKKEGPLAHHTITSAQINTSSATEYGVALAAALQQQLQLPEPGDVQATVTVDGKGQCLSIQIVAAESQINEEWLKKRLPLLLLPCFNEFGIYEATLEFSILFSHRG